MLRLVLLRLAFGAMTLLAASVLIFTGTEVLPGDLASAILQNSATPENLAELRAQLGLERPAVVRYVEWIGHAAQGNLGVSLSNQRDVVDELAPRLRNTFFLAAFAAVVAVPLAVLMGLLAAIWQNSFYDRAVNFFTLLTISVPEYLIGYLLVKYFAVRWGLFPSLANVSAENSLLERLDLTFLPMLTLVLVVVAHMMRMTRASVLNIMASPYIEMAFLKGLSKARVVARHAFPNALAPIIAVIALNLAYLVVGVVVVEAVFVYPGLGQLLVDAVSKHDVPVVQACGLIFACVFILLNLFADVMAIVSNPRLRRAR